MPNESVKPKISASEKITSILNRLPIGEAIDEYNKAGANLHDRIDADRKTLEEHKKKLSNKEE